MHTLQHTDQFMVMSFTTKRLLIYDREEDMENGPGPITTLEFSQIYTVRTLRAGEHETFRVKQSDLKKILVVCLNCVKFVCVFHQWFVLELVEFYLLSNLVEDQGLFITLKFH